MGATALAAVIIRKEKDLVRHLRDAGALDAGSAKSPAALGVHTHLAWEMLRRRDIIREATPGTFYLDDAAWEAHSVRRRMIALAILVGVFAAAFAAAYMAVRVAGR